MPPENPNTQKAPNQPPTSRLKRAVIVIADGHRTPTALDTARAHIDRRRNLRAVSVERDDGDGDGFTRAVSQHKRGEVDMILLPSPHHLPAWIQFAEDDPRT